MPAQVDRRPPGVPAIGPAPAIERSIPRSPMTTTVVCITRYNSLYHEIDMQAAPSRRPAEYGLKPSGTRRAACVDCRRLEPVRHAHGRRGATRGATPARRRVRGEVTTVLETRCSSGSGVRMANDDDHDRRIAGRRRRAGAAHRARAVARDRPPFRIDNIRARPREARAAAAAPDGRAGGGRGRPARASKATRSDRARSPSRRARCAAGDYAFSVGTAGSATLVLQTMLPPLLLARGRSTLTLEGGTHNPWAPPFDFLQRVFLPVVNRLGPRVEATLERPGFYPAGGGRFTVDDRARAAARASRTARSRGEIVSRRVRALVANLPRHIARTRGGDGAAAAELERRLRRRSRSSRDTPGPGNVVIDRDRVGARHGDLHRASAKSAQPAEAVADRAGAGSAAVPRGRRAGRDATWPISCCRFWRSATAERSGRCRCRGTR